VTLNGYIIISGAGGEDYLHTGLRRLTSLESVDENKGEKY